MTRHFNGLTEGQQERLSILIEECGEVVQAACKILRHGYQSTNPKIAVPKGEYPETNRSALEREIGDLEHAIRRLEAATDLNAISIAARATSKPDSIKPYLHHQTGDGEWRS